MNYENHIAYQLEMRSLRGTAVAGRRLTKAVEDYIDALARKPRLDVIHAFDAVKEAVAAYRAAERGDGS